MSMNSKRKIKSLMGWHKQGDPVVGQSYYTSRHQHPSSPSSSVHDNGIDVAKIVDEDPNEIEDSIVKKFTQTCDGDWIRDQVRNRRFEKQKIHTRKRCTIVPEAPSEDDLLNDLKGYNGKWRQAKAEVAWPLHVAHKESEKQRQAELEERRIKKQLIEEERMRCLKDKRQARLMEEERKRIIEQKRARQAALEEEERQKKQAAEEERLRKANEKRPCGICRGSGTCPECNGTGFFVSLYLAASVTPRCNEFHGRTARGCEDCGGNTEYSASGKLKKGNGKCSNCSGTGQVAPNNQNHLNQREKAGSFLHGGKSLMLKNRVG